MAKSEQFAALVLRVKELIHLENGGKSKERGFISVNAPSRTVDAQIAAYEKHKGALKNLIDLEDSTKDIKGLHLNSSVAPPPAHVKALTSLLDKGDFRAKLDKIALDSTIKNGPAQSKITTIGVTPTPVAVEHQLPSLASEFLGQVSATVTGSVEVNTDEDVEWISYSDWLETLNSAVNFAKKQAETENEVVAYAAAHALLVMSQALGTAAQAVNHHNTSTAATGAAHPGDARDLCLFAYLARRVSGALRRMVTTASEPCLESTSTKCGTTTCDKTASAKACDVSDIICRFAPSLSGAVMKIAEKVIVKFGGAGVDRFLMEVLVRFVMDHSNCDILDELHFLSVEKGDCSSSALRSILVHDAQSALLSNCCQASSDAKCYHGVVIDAQHGCLTRRVSIFEDKLTPPVLVDCHVMNRLLVTGGLDEIVAPAGQCTDPWANDHVSVLVSKEPGQLEVLLRYADAVATGATHKCVDLTVPPDDACSVEYLEALIAEDFVQCGGTDHPLSKADHDAMAKVGEDDRKETREFFALHQLRNRRKHRKEGKMVRVEPCESGEDAVCAKDGGCTTTANSQAKEKVTQLVDSTFDLHESAAPAVYIPKEEGQAVDCSGKIPLVIADEDIPDGYEPNPVLYRTVKSPGGDAETLWVFKGLNVSIEDADFTEAEESSKRLNKTKSFNAKFALCTGSGPIETSMTFFMENREDIMVPNLARDGEMPQSTAVYAVGPLSVVHRLDDIHVHTPSDKAQTYDSLLITLTGSVAAASSDIFWKNYHSKITVKDVWTLTLTSSETNCGTFPLGEVTRTYTDDASLPKTTRTIAGGNAGNGDILAEIIADAVSSPECNGEKLPAYINGSVPAGEAKGVAFDVNATMVRTTTKKYVSDVGKQNALGFALSEEHRRDLAAQHAVWSDEAVCTLHLGPKHLRFVEPPATDPKVRSELDKAFVHTGETAAAVRQALIGEVAKVATESTYRIPDEASNEQKFVMAAAKQAVHRDKEHGTYGHSLNSDIDEALSSASGKWSTFKTVTATSDGNVLSEAGTPKDTVEMPEGLYTFGLKTRYGDAVGSVVSAPNIQAESSKHFGHVTLTPEVLRAGDDLVTTQYGGGFADAIPVQVNGSRGPQYVAKLQADATTNLGQTYTEAGMSVGTPVVVSSWVTNGDSEEPALYDAAIATSFEITTVDGSEEQYDLSDAEQSGVSTRQASQSQTILTITKPDKSGNLLPNVKVEDLDALGAEQAASRMIQAKTSVSTPKVDQLAKTAEAIQTELNAAAAVAFTSRPDQPNDHAWAELEPSIGTGGNVDRDQFTVTGGEIKYSKNRDSVGSAEGWAVQLNGAGKGAFDFVIVTNPDGTTSTISLKPATNPFKVNGTTVEAMFTIDEDNSPKITADAKQLTITKKSFITTKGVPKVMNPTETVATHKVTDANVPERDITGGRTDYRQYTGSDGKDSIGGTAMVGSNGYTANIEGKLLRPKAMNAVKAGFSVAVARVVDESADTSAAEALEVGLAAAADEAAAKASFDGFWGEDPQKISLQATVVGDKDLIVAAGKSAAEPVLQDKNGGHVRIAGTVADIKKFAYIVKPARESQVTLLASPAQYATGVADVVAGRFVKNTEAALSHKGMVAPFAEENKASPPAAVVLGYVTQSDAAAWRKNDPGISLASNTLGYFKEAWGEKSSEYASMLGYANKAWTQYNQYKARFATEILLPTTTQGIIAQDASVDAIAGEAVKKVALQGDFELTVDPFEEATSVRTVQSGTVTSLVIDIKLDSGRIIPSDGSSLEGVIDKKGLKCGVEDGPTVFTAMIVGASTSPDLAVAEIGIFDPASKGPSKNYACGKPSWDKKVATFVVTEQTWDVAAFAVDAAGAGSETVNQEFLRLHGTELVDAMLLANPRSRAAELAGRLNFIAQHTVAPESGASHTAYVRAVSAMDLDSFQQGWKQFKDDGGAVVIPPEYAQVATLLDDNGNEEMGVNGEAWKFSYTNGAASGGYIDGDAVDRAAYALQAAATETDVKIFTLNTRPATRLGSNDFLSTLDKTSTVPAAELVGIAIAAHATYLSPSISTREMKYANFFGLYYEASEDDTVVVDASNEAADPGIVVQGSIALAAVPGAQETPEAALSRTAAKLATELNADRAAISVTYGVFKAGGALPYSTDPTQVTFNPPKTYRSLDLSKIQEAGLGASTTPLTVNVKAGTTMEMLSSGEMQVTSSYRVGDIAVAQATASSNKELYMKAWFKDVPIAESSVTSAISDKRAFDETWKGEESGHQKIIGRVYLQPNVVSDVTEKARCVEFTPSLLTSDDYYRVFRSYDASAQSGAYLDTGVKGATTATSEILQYIQLSVTVTLYYFNAQGKLVSKSRTEKVSAGTMTSKTTTSEQQRIYRDSWSKAAKVVLRQRLLEKDDATVHYFSTEATWVDTRPSGILKLPEGTTKDQVAAAEVTQTEAGYVVTGLKDKSGGVIAVPYAASIKLNKEWIHLSNRSLVSEPVEQLNAYLAPAASAPDSFGDVDTIFQSQGFFKNGNDEVHHVVKKNVAVFDDAARKWGDDYVTSNAERSSLASKSTRAEIKKSVEAARKLLKDNHYIVVRSSSKPGDFELETSAFTAGDAHAIAADSFKKMDTSIAKEHVPNPVTSHYDDALASNPGAHVDSVVDAIAALLEDKDPTNSVHIIFLDAHDCLPDEVANNGVDQDGKVLWDDKITPIHQIQLSALSRPGFSPGTEPADCTDEQGYSPVEIAAWLPKITSSEAIVPDSDGANLSALLDAGDGKSIQVPVTEGCYVALRPGDNLHASVSAMIKGSDTDFWKGLLSSSTLFNSTWRIKKSTSEKDFEALTGCPDHSGNAIILCPEYPGSTPASLADDNTFETERLVMHVRERFADGSNVITINGPVTGKYDANKLTDGVENPEIAGVAAATQYAGAGVLYDGNGLNTILEEKGGKVWMKPCDKADVSSVLMAKTLHQELNDEQQELLAMQPYKQEVLAKKLLLDQIYQDKPAAPIGRLAEALTGITDVASEATSSDGIVGAIPVSAIKHAMREIAYNKWLLADGKVAEPERNVLGAEYWEEWSAAAIAWLGQIKDISTSDDDLAKKFRGDAQVKVFDPADKLAYVTAAAVSRGVNTLHACSLARASVAYRTDSDKAGETKTKLQLKKAPSDALSTVTAAIAMTDANSKDLLALSQGGISEKAPHLLLIKELLVNPKAAIKCSESSNHYGTKANEKVSTSVTPQLVKAEADWLAQQYAFESTRVTVAIDAALARTDRKEEKKEATYLAIVGVQGKALQARSASTYEKARGGKWLGDAEPTVLALSAVITSGSSTTSNIGDLASAVVQVLNGIHPGQAEQRIGTLRTTATDPQIDAELAKLEKAFSLPAGFFRGQLLEFSSEAARVVKSLQELYDDAVHVLETIREEHDDETEGLLRALLHGRPADDGFYAGSMQVAIDLAKLDAYKDRLLLRLAKVTGLDESQLQTTDAAALQFLSPQDPTDEKAIQSAIGALLILEGQEEPAAVKANLANYISVQLATATVAPRGQTADVSISNAKVQGLYLGDSPSDDGSGAGSAITDKDLEHLMLAATEILGKDKEGNDMLIGDVAAGSLREALQDRLEAVASKTFAGVLSPAGSDGSPSATDAHFRSAMQGFSKFFVNAFTKLSDNTSDSFKKVIEEFFFSIAESRESVRDIDSRVASLQAVHSALIGEDTDSLGYAKKGTDGLLTDTAKQVGDFLELSIPTFDKNIGDYQKKLDAYAKKLGSAEGHMDLYLAEINDSTKKLNDIRSAIQSLQSGFDDFEGSAPLTADDFDELTSLRAPAYRVLFYYDLDDRKLKMLPYRDPALIQGVASAVQVQTIQTTVGKDTVEAAVSVYPGNLGGQAEGQSYGWAGTPGNRNQLFDETGLALGTLYAKYTFSSGKESGGTYVIYNPTGAEEFAYLGSQVVDIVGEPILVTVQVPAPSLYDPPATIDPNDNHPQGIYNLLVAALTPLLADLNSITDNGGTPDPTTTGKSEMYWLYMKSLKRAILNNGANDGFTDDSSGIANRVLVASSHFAGNKIGAQRSTGDATLDTIFSDPDDDGTPATGDAYDFSTSYKTDEHKLFGISGPDCVTDCGDLDSAGNNNVVSVWWFGIQQFLGTDGLPRVGSLDGQYARMAMSGDGYGLDITIAQP